MKCGVGFFADSAGGRSGVDFDILAAVSRRRFCLLFISGNSDDYGVHTATVIPLRLIRGRVARSRPTEDTDTC